jgi:hypothetical protein
MSKTIVSAYLGCAFALLGLPGHALAQFESATVLGTVHDQAGAVVRDAAVTLRNVATDFKQNIRTDTNGDFQFVNAPIGRYVLNVQAIGFRVAHSAEFDLTVGARQRVDFEVRLGTLETAVEITAEARLVEADSSSRGQVVTTKQIVELPLNGRAYSQLVYLAPGIIPSPIAGQDADSREGSFNANGLRSVFNNYLLDGIDNNYYGTSNQGFSNQVVQLSPDAVAEFRIITNNTSAEYGRSGGATVNVAMRSGTNEFHGSLWEFFRNTKLNAGGFFAPAEKPRLNRNQFGVTLGGPILRNRSFFFVDYEGVREVSSSVRFATLPNAQQRQGILGVPVVDILRQQVYTNGVIPASAMSPFARQVLDALPAVTNSNVANNYQTLVRVTDDRDKGDAKLDHIFGDSFRGFLRYSQSRAAMFDPGTIPGIAGGDANGFTQIPMLQGNGGVTWTMTANSIFEGRMGFSRSRAGKTPVLSGGASMEELFGIPGLPTDPQYTGGISYQGLVGFSALGRQFTNPQYQYPTVWNPKINQSLIAGRHSLKTGFEYQRIHVEQQDIHPVYGVDAYQGLFSATGLPTFRPEQAPLYSLADFLFGTRAAYVLASPAVANLRQNLYFAYLQDDWRVLDNLTLNLGLRYEYGSPIYERDNRLSNWNPETNTLEVASVGNISDRGLVKPDRNNFGPRVGLAWSLAPETVIRTGYGMSHVHWNRVGSSYLTMNAPFAILATALNDPRLPTFRLTHQGYPASFVSPTSYDPRQAVVQYMPRESPSGEIQSWFFSFQHRLVENLLLDVAYVGNEANNLVLINDLNQAFPNSPGQALPSQFRRRNPAFGSVVGLMPWGFSNYHGLQVKLERRAGAGLYFLNSFTWSKTIDNGSQPLDGGPGNDAPSVQNIFDLDADRGLSAYHREVVNATSVVWEVPFGRDRRFAAGLSGPANLILGGWQITAINNARSGAPITLIYQPSLANEVSPVITVFGRNQYRPNIMENPKVPGNQRSHVNYLDLSLVSVPPPTQPFGNAGRNNIIGPAFWQLDLGVYKNFSVHERMRIQFRAEAFNSLNRTNFYVPNGNVSSQSFGQINRTFEPRQLQLALKLMF